MMVSHSFQSSFTAGVNHNNKNNFNTHDDGMAMVHESAKAK